MMSVSRQKKGQGPNQFHVSLESQVDFDHRSLRDRRERAFSNPKKVHAAQTFRGDLREGPAYAAEAIRIETVSLENYPVIGKLLAY